jgi:hypothetical protein
LLSSGSHVNFPINIFINYLGLPDDSTHFNTKQTKEKMLMPSLDALKHAVTPRVLQLGHLQAPPDDHQAPNHHQAV